MDSTKVDCIPGTEHIASMGEENRKHQMLKYKITVCYIENKAKWCDRGRVIALYWVSSKPSLSTHVSLDFHEKKKKANHGKIWRKDQIFSPDLSGEWTERTDLTCIRLWNHFTTPGGRKSPIIIPAQLDRDSKGIKLL